MMVKDGLQMGNWEQSETVQCFYCDTRCGEERELVVKVRRGMGKVEGAVRSARHPLPCCKGFAVTNAAVQMLLSELLLPIKATLTTAVLLPLMF